MPKRKADTHYDLGPDSEEEDSDEELPQTSARGMRSVMLQESTLVGEDGRTRHVNRVINVMSSPLKRDAAHSGLRPDTREEEPEPYYDYVASDSDDEGEESDTDDEGARDMRDSVRGEFLPPLLSI